MKKISGKGAVIATKGFTLFILNEDVNDIIKIIKSLDDSGALIDGVTESAKDKIKKQKRLFRLATSIAQPVISSVVKGISGREVRRAERGYMDKKF